MDDRYIVEYSKLIWLEIEYFILYVNLISDSLLLILGIFIGASFGIIWIALMTFITAIWFLIWFVIFIKLLLHIKQLDTEMYNYSN